MDHNPPTIDMRLDGSFRSPARRGLPMSFKLMVGAALVALVGGSIAAAALAIWVVSMLLPVIVVAGLFGWGMLHFRRWQATRGGGGALRRF